jgi:hypothetical protein
MMIACHRKVKRSIEMDYQTPPEITDELERLQELRLHRTGAQVARLLAKIPERAEAEAVAGHCLSLSEDLAVIADSYTTLLKRAEARAFEAGAAFGRTELGRSLLADNITVN